MTDADLLALIKGNTNLRAFADAGRDNELAALVPGVATATVPKPFTSADIMGCVAPGNRAKVAPTGMYLAIVQAIQAQDRTALAAEAQLCADGSYITTAEQSAINAVLNATVSTPDTTVTHEQVSRVLNAIRPRGHYQADGSFVADPAGPVVARPISW